MSAAPAFHPDDSFYECTECSDYIECEDAARYGWNVCEDGTAMCPDCEYMAARV